MENQFEELQSKQDERETDIKELLSQLRKQQQAQVASVQNDTTPSPINDKCTVDVEKIIAPLRQFKLDGNSFGSLPISNIANTLTEIESKFNALSAIKEKGEQA